MILSVLSRRSYRGAYYFQKPDLIVTNFQIERDLLKLLMNFEILQQIEEQILSASTWTNSMEMCYCNE
nr:hypothetical protein BgiMline_020143 [Biomphalaria glabrata]